MQRQNNHNQHHYRRPFLLARSARSRSFLSSLVPQRIQPPWKRYPFRQSKAARTWRAAASPRLGPGPIAAVSSAGCLRNSYFPFQQDLFSALDYGYRTQQQKTKFRVGKEGCGKEALPLPT